MPGDAVGLEPAYLQDVIAPSMLVHGFDYGDPDPGQPGAFGYAYNFLDYLFEEDGAHVAARHYLDEPGRVLVRGCVDVGSPLVERVLIFLAMRYDEVAFLGAEGYRPWDEALRTRIVLLAEAHMRATATS